MFGYTAEEMVGKNKIRILYPDDEIDRISREIASGVREKRDSVSFETREITKTARKYGSRSIFLPRRTRWKVVGILGIGEDITELKKIEEERKNFRTRFCNREIGIHRYLGGGVAHDFNNLLMGIQGHISIAMLNAGPDSPLRGKPEGDRRIRNQGRQPDRPTVEPGERRQGTCFSENLNALILRALKDLDKDKKDVEIETDLAEDLWKVDVTETQMIQVFLNLFGKCGRSDERTRGR